MALTSRSMPVCFRPLDLSYGALQQPASPAQLPWTEPPTVVASAVVAMLGLLASLILHEMAPAEVAGPYGLRISGFTLFLFGGVMELQSESASGSSEFWIPLAGPVASLCLVLAFWFCA